MASSFHYFEKVLSIHKNPNSYFAQHEISVDTYYLDILKELCDEDLDCSNKVQLLNLLEQNSNLLLPTLDEIEQTAGSLLAIYKDDDTAATPTKAHSLPGNVAKVTNYKRQIIITLTSILLARQDESDREMMFSELIHQLKDLLLETAIKDKVPLLEYTAFACLDELESFFPGVLSSSKSEIQRLIQISDAALIPSWVSLLANVLANDIEASISLKNKEKCFYYGSVKELPQTIDPTPFKIIFQTLSNPTLVAPHTLHSLLSSLLSIYHHESHISLEGLKPSIPYLCYNYNIPLLQFALILQQKTKLFTKDQSKKLASQLDSLPTLNQVHKSQQLLYLEWIAGHYSKHQDIHDIKHLLASLKLNAFEGPDTFEKKLKIINALPLNEDCQSALLQCLRQIERCIFIAKSTRPIGSLFRSLFLCFDRCQHIKEPSHPFLSSLDTEMKTKVLPFIMEKRPKKQQLEVKLWKHHLNLLESLLGTRQHENIAKLLLGYLATLVSKLDNLENSSNVPEKILQVFHLVLSSQDIKFCKDDLEYLLFHFGGSTATTTHALGTSKLYFLALQTLSKEQLQSKSVNMDVATAPSKERKSGDKFEKSPYKKLTTPLFKIERHPEHHLYRVKSQMKPFTPDSLSNKTLLSDYFEHLATLQPAIEVTYRLHLLPSESNQFTSLFGIIVSLEGKPSCEKIKDYIIPSILLQGDAKAESRVWEPSFLIHPKVPKPLTLHCRYCFSAGKEYQDYVGTAGSDILELEDLFFPLPTSEPRILFDALWEAFNGNSISNNFFTTFKTLPRSWDVVEGVASKHWAPFLIPPLPPNMENSECEVNCKANHPQLDFGILLADKTHLLFRLHTKESSSKDMTFAEVGVDNPLVLSSFDTYLNQLIKFRK